MIASSASIEQCNLTGGKLRYEAIEKHGYKNYIVQDLGSMNEEKVNKEYIDFLQYVKEQLDMQ